MLLQDGQQIVVSKKQYENVKGKEQVLGEPVKPKTEEEVRKIVGGGYGNAKQIINENLDTLHRMANALLEKETLDSKDIDEIMAAEASPQAEGA